MQFAIIWLLFGLAADPNPEPEPTDKERQSAEEEIVVTGSRIHRKDLTTPAPVTILTREQLETSGKASLGEFLQTVPAQGNATNTQVNNTYRFPADGSIRVNLRSLGRTLVLVNGRRLPGPGDLTTIPTAAVERVEVLLDGASAIYGSDAIGGVVNVILRRGFKGTELSVSGGITQHGDGAIYEATMIAGAETDRGNVVFSGGYYSQEAIFASARPFSATPQFYNYLNGATARVGSGTVPAGRFVVQPTAVGSRALQDLRNAFPGVNSFVGCPPQEAGCTDGWRPWTGPLLAPLGQGYNYQPDNYLTEPQQRISLYSSGDLSLGSRARAYYEASFVNRQSATHLASEPLITSSLGVVVSKDNVYNPFGVDLSNVFRRMVEFPARVSRADVNAFRAVVGVDGSLPQVLGPLAAFYWDVSFNFGRIENSGERDGLLHNTKVQDAVGPSWIDASGKAHCGTDAAHDIAGCVPLDLFHGPGSIAPDQITDGLAYTGTFRNIDQLASVQANLTGDLFRLFAERPAGIAVGYEFRRYYAAQVPDAIVVAHETEADITAGVTRGGYQVNEGYAELLVPIVEHLPAAELLDAIAAGRVFDYSTSGSGVTWKLGGRWKPLRDFTLRSTWSTAFRAPDVLQLYQGHFRDIVNGPADPCADPNLQAGSPRAVACGAAFNNGNSDVSSPMTVGGNRALQPETAKIFTAGAVYEPRWLRNFSATVDYFAVALNRAIGYADPSYILNSCYPIAAGAVPRFCDLVQRDLNTHAIVNVNALLTNIGAIRSDGIDVALRYALPTSFGRFQFLFDGVWLHKIDITESDGTVIHGRGTYDMGIDYASGNSDFGGVNPAFKFNLGTIWSFKALTASVNTRFIGSFHECGGADVDQTSPQARAIGPIAYGSLCTYDWTTSSPSSPQLPPYRRTVSYFNVWDVYAGYDLKSEMGRTTFALGVNNLFNSPPPVIFSAFNTYDPSYDFYGRYVYGRVTHRF